MGKKYLFEINKFKNLWGITVQRKAEFIDKGVFLIENENGTQKSKIEIRKIHFADYLKSLWIQILVFLSVVAVVVNNLIKVSLENGFIPFALALILSSIISIIYYLYMRSKNKVLFLMFAISFFVFAIISLFFNLHALALYLNFVIGFLIFYASIHNLPNVVIISRDGESVSGVYAKVSPLREEDKND